MIIFRYDTSRYDFRGWARRALGDDLEHLHQRPHPQPLMWQRGRAYRELLEATSCDPAFQDLLGAFMGEAVSRIAGPVISYQKKPAVRVALSDCGSISGFHRDIEAGQHPDASNLWIPMTSVSGANALWIETEPDSDRYRPVPLEYGEAMIFDGGHVRHGSVANDTGSTRVSIDVRFVSRGRPE